MNGKNKTIAKLWLFLLVYEGRFFIYNPIKIKGEKNGEKRIKIL